VPVCCRRTGTRATPHNVVDAEVPVDDAYRGGGGESAGCLAPGDEDVSKLVHLCN
jgi:hypothetical protein